MKRLLLMFFVLLFCEALSQSNYPVPPVQKGHLFYIQHSDNYNTVVYDANFLDPQRLNELEPIKIYRIVYTKGGTREELTALQRKMAYGIAIKKIKTNFFEFSLMALPHKKFFLEFTAKNQPKVHLLVNGKKLVIRRLFVMKEKNHALKPKIDYVDCYGYTTEGTKEVKERLFL